MMNTKLSRRRFLGGVAGGLGAAAMAGPGLLARTAHAATPITAVEWGGGVVDAMKQIAAKQTAVEVNWVLHEGGSSAILAKIKATWPRVDYDYVSGWEGSFFGMVKEDWPEPVTVDAIPNLKDIPEKIIVKDDQGNFRAVPRAVGGIYFGYRKDTSPVEIKSIDDLWSPEFKGKLCWPGPTQNMLLQIVALALHAGGNEHDPEPGWKLMKDLAGTGNIGRVAITDTDFSNSLTSGETVAGFFSEPAWATVAKDFPVRQLTKDGLPTFLYQSGFAIMKNRENKQATLDFVNHCISPEMSAIYAEIAGEAPLNFNAKSPDHLKHLAFTAEEMDKYVYVPDFNVVLANQDAWLKRWEDEIAPLL
jgi:putative spermidine/putrescine transport system substrate-binding protein